MLGVNKGNGRGGIDRRSGDPMYLARWNWQFLGEELPFSQSDLKFRDAPASSVSFAASRVRGPFTRFSSSGGGQLGWIRRRRRPALHACNSICRSLPGTTMACRSSRNSTSRTSRTTKPARSPTCMAATPSSASSGKRTGSASSTSHVEGAIRVARVTWDTVDPGRVQDETHIGRQPVLQRAQQQADSRNQRRYGWTAT